MSPLPVWPEYPGEQGLGLGRDCSAVHHGTADDTLPELKIRLIHTKLMLAPTAAPQAPEGATHHRNPRLFEPEQHDSRSVVRWED